MKSIVTYIIAFLIISSAAIKAAEIPPPSSPVERKVDSLFVMASSGELKYRDMVEPAKEKIAEMGKAAVPRLIELYATKDARERHTINDILVKIGSPAVPVLVESLSLDDPWVVSRLAYSLGNIGDSSAVEGIIGVAYHEDWNVRSSSAGALGKIGDTDANETVIRLLDDENEIVRKSAAVAAGKLAIEKAIPELVGMLGDDYYGARYSASGALQKMGDKAIESIADSLDSENELLGNMGCTTLGLIGGSTAAEILVEQLDSNSPIRRALAVEGIMRADSYLACGAVEILGEREKHPTVLFYIEQALKKYAGR